MHTLRWLYSKQALMHADSTCGYIPGMHDILYCCTFINCFVAKWKTTRVSLQGYS